MKQTRKRRRRKRRKTADLKRLSRRTMRGQAEKAGFCSGCQLFRQAPKKLKKYIAFAGKDVLK